MIFSTGYTRMSGCFSWRTSATGCTVFVQKSPKRRHLPSSWLVDQRTACHSFTKIYLLRKLCARKSYSSSLRLLTRISLALPSANASLTRPAYIPLSQGYSQRSILARISLSLWVIRVVVSTTWAKTRGLLEFHFQSINPRHCTASTAVNRRPTLPGRV